MSATLIIIILMCVNFVAYILFVLKFCQYDMNIPYDETQLGRVQSRTWRGLAVMLVINLILFAISKALT